jgi:CheY-like chemotaxis protein
MPASSTQSARAAPVSLFYSYAHEDEKLRSDLERHLKILQHRGLIQPWHDRAIVPGALWDTAIHQQLLQADLVLLLLSSYFMGSDYILGVELKTALRRAADGSATVVPILLRPLDLEGLDGDELPMAPLLQRQGLPRDLKAVTSWRQREEAWVSVSKGLRATVADIQARRAAAAPLGVSALQVPPALRVPAAPQKLHAAPLAEAAPDPLLDAVLDNAAAGILVAQAARDGQAPEPQALRRQALALIDADHMPRLLWVDDHPEGNLAEADMLARLQIEVVQVRSTEEAMALLQRDQEGFDLVLSDWQRHAEGPDACLRLQRALQQAGLDTPLVVYHATFGAAQRQARAELARRAGLFGEAVLPAELLALVQAALRRG